MTICRRLLCALCLLAIIGLLAACPSSKSSRCKKLCQRQIECIERSAQDDVRIDENECTSACDMLERDSEGKKRVDDFAKCVAQAGDCEALLSCR